MGMIVLMLPLFFLAMYEKDGQPLETVARHFIQAKFIRPKVRPYATNNYYSALMRQDQVEKEVQAIVQNAERRARESGADRTPRTAQQSIPFQRMFPDGICRVTDSYYTKTVQFSDINYQLAQQEDKTAISSSFT